MNRVWTIEQGNIAVIADFGYLGDVAVETTFIKNADRSITILDCKRIGKSEDFTDAKIEEYLKNKEIELSSL